MRLILTALAAAVLAVFASNARATDLQLFGGSAAEAQAPNWTGIYAGVGGGAAAVVHDLQINAGPHEIFGLDGIGGEGLFATAIAGKDVRIGRVVVGAFVDGEWHDTTSEASLNLGQTTLKGEIEKDWSWSACGRAGYLAQPHTLIYALGCYTETTFDDVTVRAAGQKLGKLKMPDFSGWSAGGGIETCRSEQLCLRGEYRFTQYDSETIGDPAGLHAELEPSEHTARAVIVWRPNF